MEKYRKEVARIYIFQHRLMEIFAVWKLSQNKSYYLKVFYKIYFWFAFMFWALLFDFAMIIEFVSNIKSIAKVINVLFMLATAIAVSGKILMVKLKNRYYDNFFNLMLHKEYLPQNQEERKLFITCVELNTKVRNFYAILSASVCAIFLVAYYSIKNKSLPVPIYTFIGLESAWKYSLVYVYVSLSLMSMCSFNVAFDTLSSSLFIHLKGQLDILGHRLENIGKNTKSATQDCILQELKDCVRDYNRILVMSHDIEYLVSGPISLQIGCSVFVLIANFYVMSSLSSSGDLANLIKFAMYQSCMLSQIFIICYFGNEVSLKSSDLAFNLYNSDWYNWNKINRKLVLLMLLRFEKPICIASVNRCYPLNLAAFTSVSFKGLIHKSNLNIKLCTFIVNSSYSYFALLNQTN